MSIGLLLDADDQVAKYIFKKHQFYRMQYNAAYGIMVDGVLSGGVLLQSWNGFNVELSYYGQQTVTAGVIKCIARLLILKFSPSRVTVIVSRKSRRVSKALQKLGFVIEGTQRCFYGYQDSVRNTGMRLVMFRDRLEQIAKLEKQDDDRRFAH